MEITCIIFPGVILLWVGLSPNHFRSRRHWKIVLKFYFFNYICQFCLVRISQLSNEDRRNNYSRLAHCWTPACSGPKCPREEWVVRGEVTCDAPVPVPCESVPDGLRVLPLGPSVCVCQLYSSVVWYCLTSTFCTPWLVDKFIYMFHSY